MHIPDGFLNANTLIPAWLISISGIGYCLRKVSNTLKDKMIPLMGVMAAFVFVGQMINFPVMAGTSGHLLGAVLSAVLLGPYAGVIVITVVLIAQCLIFQDGGLTALGPNILNMAIMGSCGGYSVYSVTRKIISAKAGLMAGVALGSIFSVVAASVMCAIELSISGVLSIRVALPAIAFVYLFIGIGEAIITCIIVGLVQKARPDLIHRDAI